MNPIKQIESLFNTEIEKAIFDNESKYLIDYLTGLKNDVFEIIHYSKFESLLESNRIENFIFSKVKLSNVDGIIKMKLLQLY